MPSKDIFPMWKYYPSRSSPPGWVPEVIAAFSEAKEEIDSRSHRGLSSDHTLSRMRPALIRLGFEVEVSKSRADKLSRPVPFGEAGRSIVAYEVDGFHPGYGIVLEVEAGRGAANNGDYRDLIRTSLMVDAQYLILAMMLEYTGGGTAIRSYAQTRDRLDAVYASERLKLPLAGVLLVGY